MKIEKLEREMSNAEERGETSSSRLIKECVDWEMKAFNLEGQIKLMKTSGEYNKLGEKIFHLEYRMKQMKTPEEYKECESQIHQLEKDQLKFKFEVKELEERIKGMKTRDEYDTLMKEKGTEKLEMEKKIEKLREEIQAMNPKDEYDVLVREKNAEKLELEKKIEKLQEDLSKSTSPGSLTINTGVFGHGNVYNIQQSPEHFGMGPQLPYGDLMGIQQSPSPRTPGFQPPFQGYSTHGSLQHGPSGSFSQSPQPGFFGTSSQFSMHPPVYGQSLPPRPGFDAGSPMHPSVGMGFGVGPSPPPGLNYPPGFQQSNSPPVQGQFGKFRLQPPPTKVAPPSYKFLVSGGVEGGVTTMNVPPALNQKLMDQITGWSKSSKGSNWSPW
ncbi:hypothetical protein EAF00_010145 [Botryotinia globosa]|nr:hypothetical protein EAF00_010145 [Botryotinia globosa]